MSDEMSYWALRLFGKPYEELTDTEANAVWNAIEDSE